MTPAFVGTLRITALNFHSDPTSRVLFSVPSHKVTGSFADVHTAS